jgi:hypothetical protein
MISASLTTRGSLRRLAICGATLFCISLVANARATQPKVSPQLKVVVSQAFGAVLRDEQNLVACSFCQPKETVLFNDAYRFAKKIYNLPPFSGANFQAANAAYQSLRDTQLMCQQVLALNLEKASVEALLAKTRGFNAVLTTLAENPNYFVGGASARQLAVMARAAHDRAETAATLLGLTAYP